MAQFVFAVVESESEQTAIFQHTKGFDPAGSQQRSVSLVSFFLGEPARLDSFLHAWGF